MFHICTWSTSGSSAPLRGRSTRGVSALGRGESTFGSIAPGRGIDFLLYIQGKIFCAIIIRGWQALVSTWSQSKIDPCVRWKVKPRIYLLHIKLYSQLEYYIIKSCLQILNQRPLLYRPISIWFTRWIFCAHSTSGLSTPAPPGGLSEPAPPMDLLCLLH